jgi:SAM-dependent methyltransferase
VTFSKLNIEEDPTIQGYEIGQFDLVLFANVPHTTMRSTQALRNIRKLLKPGGKLMFVEMTTLKAQPFPFTFVPRWWICKSRL